MNNFSFYNPTRIFFGENSITNLSNQIKEYNNILITYGFGSIKKNGLYDSVISILKSENKNIFELNEITPNPRLDKVYEGIEICKKNNIDFILAIGGGSTTDCSKAIAMGSKAGNDVWDFYSKGIQAKSALPLGVILTLSATGTEMDPYSVITNWDTKEKLDCACECCYPKFSILDPTYTYSLPREQTVYGSIDIIAHVFEQYFSYPNNTNLSDNISESIIKTVIENLNIILNNNPNDYNARANLMWCSTMALNGIIGLGKEQDWNSHNIEHALSGIYDIPHGAGLSIILPSWMKYVYKNAKDKFKRYSIEIWNTNSIGKTDDEIILEGIEKTKQYFSSIGSPVSLIEVGITVNDIEKILEKININGNGSFIKIYNNDVREILKGAL